MVMLIGILLGWLSLAIVGYILENRREHAWRLHMKALQKEVDIALGTRADYFGRFQGAQRQRDTVQENRRVVNQLFNRMPCPGVTKAEPTNPKKTPMLAEEYFAQGCPKCGTGPIHWATDCRMYPPKNICLRCRHEWRAEL